MKHNLKIIEKTLNFFIKHPKIIISLLLLITVFFACQLNRLQIDANIFGFSSAAEEPKFIETPKEKPSDQLYLKKIGNINITPEHGEVVESDRTENIFSEEEYVNPIEYVEKEILPYTWPEGRNDSQGYWDGYVIVFSSTEMFTPEVLNTLFEVRARLSERWEIGPCLSAFDYVTVEKKGTRLRIVPISPVQDGEVWTQEDADLFKERLMNDSVAKDYLYSADGTTIMLYYRARGLNETSIAELDDIVNPLRQYGRVALNGGGLLTNAVYKYLNKDLITLLVLCFVVILVVFFLSYRTLKSMLIPASVSMMGIIWTLGIMVLAGYKLTIVTILTPCLVLTFGSSYSLHMINEYFEALSNGEKNRLSSHYSKIAKTIFFAMATTVSGFLSQLVCRIEMFREFGITISIGVFICAFLSFTFIPAILSLTKIPNPKKISRIKHGFLSKFITIIASKIVKYWWIVIVFFIAITVFFFVIKDDMGFDSNYMKYFPSDDPIVQDSIYFAKTLGGTDPYYLTIKAPNNEKGFFLQPDNLKDVYAYEMAILAADPDIVQVLSFSQYVSFLNEVYNGEKGIPDNSGLINLLSRTLMQISKQLDTDVLDVLINEDASEITLSMRNYDYVEQDLQTMPSAKRLEQTLDYYRYMLPEGTSSKIWSGASSGLHASEMIIEDQNKATIISMILIVVFASISCCSIYSGLISLFPVVTAVMSIYVFMWITNIPFDMVTIGFSSVAIGAGVDDAIHFLIRLKDRRMKEKNESYIKSIQHNILDTGRPIILTTLSVDAGLLMLLFASFNPIKYFGILMCLALTVAMLSTLLVLPSFLILFNKIKNIIDNKTINKNRMENE